MKEKIAGLSILANFILASLKIITGILVNSTAILAEGIHSGMDIFASAISFIGIKIGKKPVDKKHPYGHYKFEVLAGLTITFILLLTGIGIVYEAYQGFQNPSEVKIGYLALGVMLLSVAINEIMARLKISYGKKENSISLLSDGIHSKVDVYASIAVLIGIILTKYWIYADPLLALLVGLYIIKESFELGKEATDSLLDVSAGEKIDNRIKQIIEKQNITVSEIKTQKKGSAITANIEIKLPEKLTVNEASTISEKLKRKLIDSIEPLEYIAIQIKSHKVTDSFFKSKSDFGIGKAIGWKRKQRFKDEIKSAKGAGPEGYCICPKCGYKQKHIRGAPCSTIKCPKCKTNLTRK